jgi:peptidoglycan/xylan/chitin deacetylase (PgdA/CDA1 family)
MWVSPGERPGRVRALRHLSLATTAVALLVAGPAAREAVRPTARPAPAVPAHRTVVSLTFNDGAVSQFTYAAPALAEHHQQATFFVATGAIDDHHAAAMQWWQLDRLYAEGHEIGGMGRAHTNLTTRQLDAARLRREVCEDARRLKAQGYDPTTFAYPAGAANRAAEQIVRSCGYRAARAAGGLTATGRHRVEPPGGADRFAVRTATTPSGPLQLGTLQRAVRAAAGRGGWLPLAFNQVCHAGDREYTGCMTSSKPIRDDTLRQFLDWLAAAGKPGGAPAGVTVSRLRDALRLPPSPPLPARPTVVSLTFDDGSASQYLARQALLEQRMRGTFYLNSGTLGRQAGIMSLAQARRLRDDGNDMGGHTVHHVKLPGLPHDQAVTEVCSDRVRLRQLGFAAVSFAYPFGAFSPQAEAVARSCGYRSGRTAGSLSVAGPLYAESVPPKDRFGIRLLNAEVPTARGPVSLAHLERAVLAASNHGGGWVPVLFHELCDPRQRTYTPCMSSYRATDLSVFVGFLRWLRDEAPGGVTVRTVAQVVG